MDAQGLVKLRVEADPSPASRPRVSKWGTYYAKSYQQWVKAVQETAAGSVLALAEPFEGPLLVLVDILVAKPRTSKLTRPRGDVDNYVKGVLDGLTKAMFWRDDSDIEVLITSKRWTRPGEQPGAVIHIGAI